MAAFIKKGDAVKLLEPLEIVEQQDANRNKFWTAKQHWDAKNMRAPYPVFDAFVGIYMGTEYVPTPDRKSENGRVDKLRHCFFFNNSKVFIDPKYVEIVARFDDSVG